jgi:cell division protein FtsZ
MTLNLSMPVTPLEIKPRITVVGVGGAGGNAVNNMIRSNLEGVEFVVCNTDSQALAQSICERRIQLGVNITQGLGAGSRPDIGRGAAEEALDEIIEQVQGSNMVFITAGMGGGTGTGAAPVIARAAREHGILTVGVVTKPFHFEGLHRMRLADGGINELQQFVDTLIIIPNQNLFRIANEKTTFAAAFNMADEVLHSGVRGVTDLMVMPGLINLDFADIRAVMTEMGKAMMGTGEAEGENRAVAAAEAAISNPLLDDVSMKGARGVLINITGGLDMTLFEVDEAANRIRDEVDPEANIIFGSTFDQSLEGKIRISVVATGIDAEANTMPRPVSLSLVANGGRVVGAQDSAALRSAEQSVGAQASTAEAQEMLYEEQQPMAVNGMPMGHVEPASGAGAKSASATAQLRSERSAVAAESVIARTDGKPVAAAQPNGDQPFIAPPPVEAPARIAQAPAGRSHGGYAADAGTQANQGQVNQGQVNQGTGGERRRMPNLFARVTGSAAAWARQAGSDLREASPAAMINRVAGQEPSPRSGSAGSGSASSGAAAPQSAAQPRLAGLDPKERLSSGQADEDLLDIPAFLRRQAN